VDQLPVETTSFSLAPGAPPPPSEEALRDLKPREQRHLSLFRVGALEIDGRRELCLIRNVSSGGMQLRAYSPVSPGARLVVEFKQGEPIAGTAAWIRDGAVGMAFDEPVDIVALITASADGPQPRMPRIEIECSAWVREGADPVRTKALNISQGGVRIESAIEWSVGARVVVSIPGLKPEAGVIKWRDDNRYGIAFNSTLSVSDLVNWLNGHQGAMRAAG
jgi:hypothetical protein